jgi:heme/copper-type cytochrome/quinol oxidase subunit 1
MHSLGIIGFPRRIYDYSMIFFKFQWFNSLGLIGIYLSIAILLFAIILARQSSNSLKCIIKNPINNPLL